MTATAKSGIAMIFLSAITVGLFPVLVHIQVQSIPPLALAFVTHLCAFVGALAYGLYEGSLAELWNKKYLATLSLIAITIIVIPLSLFYVGASLTSGINTSALTLSEIVFTVLFAQFWGEQLTKNKVLGAVAILSGAILLLYQPGGTWRMGDFIILFSTITYPIGNFLQKKMLKQISPASLLVGRLALAVPILGVMYLLSNEAVQWGLVWQNHWIMILVIGLVNTVIGKILWFKGLKTIDVTTGVSLVMTFPLYSVLFLWLSGTETISMKQLLGIGIMLVGVYYALRLTTKKSLPKTV